MHSKPVAIAVRPKKPIKQPDFKVLGPKNDRPKSAPVAAAKKVQQPHKPPPFLAYGYRDKERQIGDKKTHNVRASAEVSAFYFE